MKLLKPSSLLALALILAVFGAVSLLNRKDEVQSLLKDSPQLQVETQTKRLLSAGDLGMYDLAWNPDGITLAYVGGSLRSSEGSNIGIVSLNQWTEAGYTELGLIAEPSAWEHSPSWSPNGASLVYVSDPGREDLESMTTNRPGVWVANKDGTGRRMLTKGNVTAFDPSWTPDGEKIVYIISEHPDRAIFVPSSIWIMNRNGTDQKQLIQSTQAIRNLQVSPNGEKVLYLTTGDPESSAPLLYQLWIMNIDGSSHERIFQAKDASTPIQSAFWSPDGKTIVLSDGSVQMISASGETLQDFGKGASPAWGPDGRYLAYFKPKSELWLVDVEKGSGTPVVKEPASAGLSGIFAWNPQGQEIAFFNNYTEVWLVRFMIRWNAVEN